MSKIIFLDIDGPMIPGTFYMTDHMVSWKRIFPPTTIGVMNELCKRTGAKVVLNTTHNRPFSADVPEIKDAMIAHGFLAEYFHKTHPHTDYPNISRDLAVKMWLNEHPETEAWVALDDVKFTEEPNLIWVDPDVGISIANMNEALRHFGECATVLLM